MLQTVRVTVITSGARRPDAAPADQKRGGCRVVVPSSSASLTTDEVLERIQQQMSEVMASAQQAAHGAVANESEARAAAATAVATAELMQTGDTRQPVTLAELRSVQ